MTSDTVMREETANRSGNRFAAIPGIRRESELRAATGKLRAKSSPPVMRCRKIAVAAVMIRAGLAPMLAARALRLVRVEGCRRTLCRRKPFGLLDRPGSPPRVIDSGWLARW